MALTVLIIDDHPVVRGALKLAVLNAWPDAAVFEAEDVGTWGGGLGAPSAPDLIILDLCLPSASGLSNLVAVRRDFPHAKIAIFSSLEGEGLVASAHRLGAQAFLSKSLPITAVVASLQRIWSGQYEAAQAEDPPPGARTEMRSAIDALSTAQLRVLMALAGGKRSSEIAGGLGVAEATVKAHLTAIYKGLGVRSRTEAVLAYRHVVNG